MVFAYLPPTQSPYYDYAQNGYGVEIIEMCVLDMERRENFLLRGQLSVLTLISVSVPSRVTAVARKRPRTFCQKRRWQVTAKHAYTLRMWLCMK